MGVIELPITVFILAMILPIMEMEIESSAMENLDVFIGGFVRVWVVASIPVAVGLAAIEESLLWLLAIPVVFIVAFLADWARWKIFRNFRKRSEV